MEYEKFCRKLEAGNNEIILADRGTFMGYNMLVNDMTCFPIMSYTGYPVCYDATHSVQLLPQWEIFQVGNVNLFRIWSGLQLQMG